MGDPSKFDETTVEITIQRIGGPVFIPDEVVLGIDEDLPVDSFLTALNVDNDFVRHFSVLLFLIKEVFCSISLST